MHRKLQVDNFIRFVHQKGVKKSFERKEQNKFVQEINI